MRTPDCSLLYGGLSGVVPLMSGALAPLRRLHFDELPYLRTLMSKHFYSFSTCLHLVQGQALLQLLDLRMSSTPLLRLHWAARAPCTAATDNVRTQEAIHVLESGQQGRLARHAQARAERPLLPCTPLRPCFSCPYLFMAVHASSALAADTSLAAQASAKAAHRRAEAPCEVSAAR